VGVIARQVVGSVTTLSVLLCTVFCACASADPPHVNPRQHEGKNHSCHGHGDAEHHDQERKESDPSKDTDHSCQHCQPNITARLSNVKSVKDFTPFTNLLGMHHLAVTHAVVTDVETHWSILGDLSPPPAPTLLRLHCALNT